MRRSPNGGGREVGVNPDTKALRQGILLRDLHRYIVRVPKACRAYHKVLRDSSNRLFASASFCSAHTSVNSHLLGYESSKEALGETDWSELSIDPPHSGTIWKHAKAVSRRHLRQHRLIRHEVTVSSDVVEPVKLIHLVEAHPSCQSEICTIGIGEQSDGPNLTAIVRLDLDHGSVCTSRAVIPSPRGLQLH